MTHTFDDSIAEVRAVHEHDEAEARAAREQGEEPNFDTLFKGISELLRPIVEHITEVVMPAAEKVMKVLYDEYLEQGAIYGENQEGMLRWIRELGEADKYTIRATYIHQRHQMLRDLKEKLDEANAT